MLYEYEKTRAAALRELNNEQNAANRFTEITEKEITEKVYNTEFEHLVLTGNEFERIEALIRYYDVHGVKRILEKHPDFIVDDFTELLAALKSIMEID